jgi:hypothetical protein
MGNGGTGTDLNEGTRGSGVRHQEPDVVHLLMRVQPIDSFAGKLDDASPVLGGDGKFGMYRAVVRYSHKHPPEDHANAGIEQMQKT